MHVEPIRVSVRFEPALLAVLDAHRRALPDIPNRAEAIRGAVRALATQPTRKSSGKARKQRGKS
jgi:Arc/MetJ-type ribon-helix-helix transcriptional regulator